MSSYEIDKRFSSISLGSSMYHGHYPSASQSPALPMYSESNNLWSGDSMASPDYSPRRWHDDRRGYQQPFLSDCRTTINEMDSPAFQPLLLPTEVSVSSMMSSHARIQRGTGYMDSPSTDPGELSDHSSSGSWVGEPWSFGFDNGRSPPNIKRSRSSTSSPDWASGLNVSVPPYDSNWTHIIAGPDSSVTPYTPQQTMLLNGFVFPHRFSPLPESPSPPPMYQDSHISPSASLEGRATSASHAMGMGGAHASTRGGAGSANLDPNVKRCSHCKATQTPLWRRDPTTFKPLCNACGLYLQQRNRLRPQVLIDADVDDEGEEEDQNYVGPECSHCRTHHTSVWRRSKTGAQLCNACGVYARLRGKPRPLSLKRNKIKPRSKHPKP
ncbi:hypothetical protein D9611_013576 [Ephemerocybe angulata]|nr:hypothetical protein D9611_013576 [Tulosesus angulatus]